MGTLMFKVLIKQFDSVADDLLPLPRSKQITAWAALHGWDAGDTECQRLLVRQALLNAALVQAVPGLKRHAMPTPLDRLDVEPPQALIESLLAAAQHSRLFNFWGELYSALIPQAHRRQIGQFWTNELIAEWMIAWLFQFHPTRLADIGCGAGDFLLKAAQRLGRDAPAATTLYGSDVSPVLLNVVFAAFLSRKEPKLPRPTLTSQNYLDA